MAELTREAVDWFFENFARPGKKALSRDKQICDMRLQGKTYQEIGDKFNVSRSYAAKIAQDIVRKHIKFLENKYLLTSEITEKEINYIKVKYSSLTVGEIAQALRRPVNMIEMQISELMAQGIIANYNRSLNPNPVTDTTKMLICRYYEDNMNKGMTDAGAKYNIACELSRPVKTIVEILSECRVNGMHEFYNQYGTELRMGGVEW